MSLASPPPVPRRAAPASESPNRFHLLRRLAHSSLVALAVTATGLILMYRFNQIDEHRELAQEDNERITRRVSELHEAALTEHLRATTGLGGEALRQHPGHAKIDALISPYLSRPVVKVKLFNPSGQVIYSSVANEAGSDGSNHIALDRVLHGETLHSMEFRPTFASPLGDLRDRHLIQTYLPLRHGRRVVGVFEVYSDITETIERIEARMWPIGLSVLGAFALLYAALYLTARGADRALASWQDERARAETQTRIAATAFESQQAMLITDSDAVILQVNRAFTETTGYTADEVIGKTPRVLKSGRHDTDFYRTMWQALRADGSWYGEIWDRRKNGEVYPKWLSISGVRDRKGAVSHYVAAFIDISERKKAEEQIRRLAFYDHLTGLPNRTLLLDRLRQAMSSGARSGRYGALLFIDMDHFKTLNDTMGHDIGDLLLKQVGERLASCVRGEDTVSRIGGDEFVVMLNGLSTDPGDAAAHAEQVGEKILGALARSFELDAVTYQSTCSIGISMFHGHEASPETVMKQADLAMYRSKNIGRNTQQFFDPRMEAAAVERAVLDADLRQAVDQGQFRLHYQIQVDADGRPVGAEALIRWSHPSRGLVLPDDFIPFAEENGQILPIGNWVLETACRQLAAWAAQPGRDGLKLAVNVSPRQFRQTRFVGDVLDILDRTGADPHRLKLELTESTLLADVAETIGKMHALKARGIDFALDDFGTGYSSLSYLKRLPLSELKIDRSFVTDVLTDPNAAAIASTIVVLAQTLGLEVLAEGVETTEQRHFLARIGCQVFQGFLFGEPMTQEEFDGALQESTV